MLTLFIGLAMYTSTAAAQEPGRSVYGLAGGPESYYHGVEKPFGETHYTNPELDANPDNTDPAIYNKGNADATDADTIYPMDSAGSGEPATPERSTSDPSTPSKSTKTTTPTTPTTSILPDGELNSLKPVSSDWISQRRGSQETTIGAGSGTSDDVVAETRKGRLFKRRRRLLSRLVSHWQMNSMEQGDVGSGLALGSERITPENPNVSKKGNAVPPLLTKTIGLKNVKPDNNNNGGYESKIPKGPTTNSVYPKWMSHVGSDAIATPTVVEVRSQLRGIGRSQDIEATKFVSTVGTGIGQQVDTLGFPIPDGK